MSFDLYLVPPGFGGSFDGYDGLRVRDVGRLRAALESAPATRLGDLVAVVVSEGKTVWETSGFTVEILWRPDGSELVVLGVAMRLMAPMVVDEEQFQLERVERGGLFDTLLDVADAADAVWWSPTEGGPVTRADRDAFVDPPGDWGTIEDVPGMRTSAPPVEDLEHEAIRDGRAWRIGTADDVAWIRTGTTLYTRAITAAIPPVFEAYAIVALPFDWEAEQAAHDAALLEVLRAHSRSEGWWLGYLDTGADDVVFPRVPKVTLYARYPYVLIEAGPDQAATWRHSDGGTFWKGSLPNLIFPVDHVWLISTLWDDDWARVGGTAALIDDLVAHPVLAPRARAVTVEEDATPLGHKAS